MTAASPLRFETRVIREQEGLAQEINLDSQILLAGTESEARPAGPISAKVEFSVGGNSILLQAQFSGAWKLPCSRCLVEHEAPFACGIEETYPASDEVVDITDDARQAVLLELPSRSLCRPDCRGLCPRCGKNLNEGACACGPINPGPFEALKNLRPTPQADPKEN